MIIIRNITSPYTMRQLLQLIIILNCNCDAITMGRTTDNERSEHH